MSIASLEHKINQTN